MLVNQQIMEVLAEMGVLPIPTLGEEFDPNFHEAVAIEVREGLGENTICDELMRGYRIGDKIIRHSMVKVVGSGMPRVSEFKPVFEESLPAEIEPLPPMDEDVEELIASSYAKGVDDEQGAN